MTNSSPGCLPRWSTPRTDRPTYGGRVAEVAELLGTPLMPWQRHVADVALEVNPATGKLVYREVVLTVPRQSGKTTLLLSLMVQRAQAFGGRQRIVYTAQTRNDARQKWEDEHVAALESSKFEKRIRAVRKTNGNEAILWRNGSSHGIIASGTASGHGKTLDLGVLDEAFAQVDSRVEQAMSPAMITRPQPQLWIVSTAGDANSTYLWGKVENGRARAETGATDLVAYFEWAANPDADPGAVSTWFDCMPALGYTQTVEAVAAEFAKMPLPDFRRAFLNLWDARRGDPVISAEAWKGCEDVTSRMTDPVCFAVDVSPDRSTSSIAAAGRRADGFGHVEVVENRPGTGWVADRLVELRDYWKPSFIVLDPASPAGALLNDLVAKGVDLKLVTSREHSQACGQLFDDVSNRRFRHIGQPVLTAAVDGADRRTVSDAWLWSRKSSAVDISPLVAVTLAAWAASQPVETTDLEPLFAVT